MVSPHVVGFSWVIWGFSGFSFVIFGWGTKGQEIVQIPAALTEPKHTYDLLLVLNKE
jgi:hypothetical protein